MLGFDILILVVLVVGFLSLHWRLQIMREDIDEQLDELATELADINTVAEGAVTLIERQNEQLRELATSDADADTLKARLTSFVAAADAAKVKIANALASGTAATTEDKPVEQPLPEPEPVVEQPVEQAAGEDEKPEG